MWQWLSRILLAVVFLAVVGVVVLNGRGVMAQGGGTQILFFPLMQKPDLSLHDYMGLVRVQSTVEAEDDFYTVRGDTSEWGIILADVERYSPWAWSPDGFHLAVVDGDTLWLVPLATRTPRIIVENVSGLVYWSPDSHAMAFYTHQNQLAVYDVITEQLTVVDEVGSSGSYRILWSPDSQRLAWRRNEQEVWMLPAVGGTPRLVYQGSLPNPSSFYWSPDGNRFLFGGNTDDIILATNGAGDYVTIFLQGYAIRGWVNDGAHILLWKTDTGQLYLANPDGSGIMPFQMQRIGHTQIAPSGDRVLLRQGFSDLVQATNSSIARPAETECESFRVKWLEDGHRFTCTSTAYGHGYYGSRVADTDDDPITVTSLPGHLNPQRVPGPNEYLATDLYGLTDTGGYPSPYFIGSTLVHLETGYTKRIVYPTSNQYPILEWRYMP